MPPFFLVGMKMLKLVGKRNLHCVINNHGNSIGVPVGSEKVELR